MTRFALLALSTLLLAAGCARERPVEVHGTVERDRLELIAESNERIVEIAVHEGDHVQAGAVLVRQEAGIAQPRIDQSRAAVLEAQRRLADLEQGPRQREIDEARATLGGAESELQTAQSEFARVQTLVQRKLLSESNLDQARATRDSARAARDAARARYELLQQGTRTEQVAAGPRRRPACDRGAGRSRNGRLALHGDRAARRHRRGPAVQARRASRRRPTRRDPARRRRSLRPRLRARTAAHEVHRRHARRSDRRWPRGALKGTVRYVSAEAAFTPYYALTQKDRSRLAYLAEITLDDPAAQALPAGLPIQVLVPAAQP